MKHPLMQLVRDNANKPQALRFENSKTDAGDETTIYLYGVIGGFWGDISAQDFATLLSQTKSDVIHLRINSPGGDVFEARSMMTALAQHKAKVIAHVDGLAASAATDIVMAADEAEISRGARFMIHNAWTVTMGNKADHQTARDLLATIDDDIAADYQKRTGADRAQIVQWMDNETWFNADQAVEHKFVDRVVDVVKNADARAWDLSAYAKVPEDLKNPPPPPKMNAYDREACERRWKLLNNLAA